MSRRYSGAPEMVPAPFGVAPGSVFPSSGLSTCDPRCNHEESERPDEHRKDQHQTAPGFDYSYRIALESGNIVGQKRHRNHLPVKDRGHQASTSPGRTHAAQKTGSSMTVRARQIHGPRSPGCKRGQANTRPWRSQYTAHTAYAMPRICTWRQGVINRPWPTGNVAVPKRPRRRSIQRCARKALVAKNRDWVVFQTHHRSGTGVRPLRIQHQPIVTGLG